MKIDVITLHAVQNYGSVLQALATQKLFESYGHNVTIINYVRENVKPENLLKSWCGKNIVKMLVMYPTIRRWKKVFGDYCKQNLNLSENRYTTEEDFKNYPLEADIFCTGSDQVWNSQWNRGYILPLYLSFVPDNKFRFAYAASFGQDKLTQDEIQATKEYILKYNYISVRENSGKKIIEEQYGYHNATWLLDPTLAMPAEFWRTHSTKRIIKKDYILIYNLNRSKAFDKYCVKLAKKTGLKLVRLCTRYDQFYRPGKSVLVPTIPEFISLIDNATYVITDSFHATAFSMNMNSAPVCIYPKEFGGRLKSFLQLTNSEQRHVRDYNDFDVVNRKVNFEEVNEILQNIRKNTDDFLKQVFKSAEEYYGK